MRDPLNWSLNVGRISGIPLRLHLFFVLFAGFQVVYAALNPGFLTPAAAALQAFTFVLLLFAGVLLHELGHCAAAGRVGGRAREILMWPLGGLATVDFPQSPRNEAIVTVAGPLVNVVLGSFCAGLLLVSGYRPPTRPLEPIRSFEGELFLEGWPFWVGTFFAINLMLVLFNLLPAFPMDGGRLLRAALWTRLGHREATLWAVQVAKVTAIGMVMVAIYLGLKDDRVAHTVLLLIGIFVYHSAELERYRTVTEEFLGEGFGWDTPEEEERAFPKARRKSWWQRWLERWRRAREERARRIEMEEERRMDELLDQVRKYGYDSLTPAEQRFLKRVSKRYRSKLESRQD